MAENELQKLIKGIFNYIKEKYGYTDEQALIYLQGLQDCAKENQQSLEKRDKMLRDTVEELCEAKRLLKEATKVINEKCDGFCEYCKYYTKFNLSSCELGIDVCENNNQWEWKYEAEVLKLIKED